MMIVNTADFVSALKSLKVHMKARRNMNLLIRDGDGIGERILELSGRSRFSGILTSIHCDGDWGIEVAIPVSSLRGLALHPPGDQTVKIAYSNGRFHVGAWSCPAKLNSS